MKYCDVRTNYLKQYRKECMKNGVQKMHVDFKASDLWDTNSVRRFMLPTRLNRTETSADDGARKSNTWPDQWQSGKLGTGSRV